MTDGTGTLNDFARFDRNRSSRKAFPHQSLFSAAALAFSIVIGGWILYNRAVTIGIERMPAAVAPVVATMAPHPAAAPHPYVALLDPGFSLGSAPVSLSQSVPLGSEFASLPSAVSPVAPEPESPLPLPLQVPTIPLLVQSAPLPALRAPEFLSPTNHAPLRPSGRQIARQSGTAARPDLPPGNRNFFEKLFGAQQQQPSGAVLAYAAPESGFLRAARSFADRPVPLFDRQTAIYDIAAHTVYMPDGTRLEAHSGLGSRQDDPRYVNERNRGATPPHVYELVPRERLFHGVQALRLNPIGGGSVYGRTGLLAHSYMLGPRGASNGCVSFRNYNAFLRAFLKGEVKRLVVVARLN